LAESSIPGPMGGIHFQVEMIHRGLEEIYVASLGNAVEEGCRKRIGKGTSLDGNCRYFKVAEMKMDKVKYPRSEEAE